MPSSDSPDSGSISLSSPERIHVLIEWLRIGRRFTSSVAAEHLGVSRRTVVRDLDYIRRRLSLDVSYDANEQTYVLSDEHAALPFLASPGMAPVLLNSEVHTGDPDDLPPGSALLRFSERIINVYITRGGFVPEGVSNPDGSLDVRFTPQNEDAFTSYVLSQGSDVQVLAPAEFRHRVLMEIRRMLALYESDCRPAS